VPGPGNYAGGCLSAAAALPQGLPGYVRVRQPHVGRPPPLDDLWAGLPVLLT